MKHKTDAQLSAFIKKYSHKVNTDKLHRKCENLEDEIDSLWTAYNRDSRRGLSPSHRKLISKINTLENRLHDLQSQVYELENSDAGYEDADELFGMCGIIIIEGLKAAVSPRRQAIDIAAQMLKRHVRQVMITDVANSGYWGETKAIAHQGPITKNYNTGNQVCHWSITDDMLEEIANCKTW